MTTAEILEAPAPQTRRTIEKRVGDRVEVVPMGAGDLDPHQDVLGLELVSRAAFDLDEVIPERRGDRIGDGVERQLEDRVAEQKAREQQFVQPGQALLEILDDSSLDLDFIVPSKWLAWLKVGQSFKVAIDENGQSYPARVTRLGARIDPVSQSVTVAAVIDGHFPELIAGMSGRVLLAPPAR